ncbi:MAG: GGDEF domain-containing phosphodiesterase [Bacillota bacterium]|jgi:EAL domain-containing protein (putative c-di-GMP-specific phosphodiesterase class I)/GGDEF domain-containing protein|nr:GGDEF domain-containing phosphodiesterase [Bacillota bacterium]
MVDKLLDLFYTLQSKKNFNTIAISAIMAMEFVVTAIVYISGGTTSFVHLMYIPIILSVVLFNIKTGIIVSLLAGLLLGPYMPLIVSQGIKQETVSWLFRIVMFIIITFVTGILFQYVKKMHDLEKEKYYYDTITGFPNINKFNENVSQLIKEKVHKSISFVIFDFYNREMINQYVNYDIGQKTYEKLLNMAKEHFGFYQLYSIDTDKFVIVLPGIDCFKAHSMTEGFYRLIRKPIYIEKLPISVVLKAGIVNYPSHGNNADDIVLKLNQSLSQILGGQKNIVIYDDSVQSIRSKYYNKLVSIYYALQNDMFTVHYQPIIRLSDNKLLGVEALLRIQDNTYKGISVHQLITIAEEVGFINEITKWVIKKVIGQIKNWKDKGIDMNVSINLSSRDFNESICEYTLNCLKLHDIEPSALEFEFTERSIIEDEIRVLSELSLLKKAGVKLSLDDYGTGHNSLYYLTNPSFYFDYIKIDRAFINAITEEKTRILISGIIDTAHVQGIEVIAEGVETHEQLKVMSEINCDHVQGYYFSKAIPPENLAHMITIGEYKYCKC